MVVDFMQSTLGGEVLQVAGWTCVCDRTSCFAVEVQASMAGGCPLQWAVLQVKLHNGRGNLQGVESYADSGVRCGG